MMPGTELKTEDLNFLSGPPILIPPKVKARKNVD